MNTKTLVAGLGASAAITAGALYNKSATLEDNILTGEDYKFMQFVTEQGRSYATKSEFQFRSKIFKQYLADMEEHNTNPVHTHKVAVNHLSDLTFDEKKRLNGYKQQIKLRDNHVFEEANLATEVDWRSKGAVTPVKNQGQCGSCWAFSTTGAVEGAMQIATGTLESYSEQQLVDCSRSYQNAGCNGGLMDNAFKYIKAGNKLEKEADYQYTGSDGRCNYSKSKGVGNVKGFKDVTPRSPSQLKAALNSQPVSVAIQADQMAFQGFHSGVITSGCGQQLDHGVLAVGYGILDNQEYFLVKNSWGPSWGVGGYVRISTSSSNVCGILSDPSFPTE